MDVLSIITHSISEFLPISSSAHHMLLARIGAIGVADSGQSEMTNIALHFGSLLAICVFFYKSIWKMLCGLWRQLVVRKINNDARQAWLLVLATVPAVIIGLFMKKLGLYGLKSLLLTGVLSILFGIFLWVADQFSKTKKKFTYMKAFLVGLGQCFAFLPGASRLGSCITMARLVGMDRKDAIKFSFLLSIPTILGAVILTVLDILKTNAAVDIGGLAIMTGITAALSLLFLCILNRYMQRHGFFVLMLYRITLGAGLIYFSI